MDLSSEALIYCLALLLGDGVGGHMPTIRNGVGQTRCHVTSLWEYLKASLHLILRSSYHKGKQI